LGELQGLRGKHGVEHPAEREAEITAEASHVEVPSMDHQPATWIREYIGQRTRIDRQRVEQEDLRSLRFHSELDETNPVGVGMEAVALGVEGNFPRSAQRRREPLEPRPIVDQLAHAESPPTASLAPRLRPAKGKSASAS